jgi:putative ABC transport system substrate-binding protein
MKKVLALICVMLLVVSMTACGGNDSDKIKIGICQIQTHPALDAATSGFVDTLYAAFGEDGVEFDVQIAAGDSNTCSTIVNAFVAEEVDLILANATPSLQAAANATEDIPILGTSVTEYGVALGIENFSGTVGTNVSGTSDLAPLDQQAAMVKEWFPDAATVGLLYCSAEANSKYQVDKVQEYLEADGITCKQFAFSATSDLEAVTRQAAEYSDVIYVPTDNTVAEGTGIVDSVCRAAGVPVIAGEQGICAGCGVATLSIDYYDLGVATGMMAVEILKNGADISTMPVAYSKEFTSLYNEEICTALNLTVPEGYAPISE